MYCAYFARAKLCNERAPFGDTKLLENEGKYVIKKLFELKAGASTHLAPRSLGSTKSNGLRVSVCGGSGALRYKVNDKTL